MFVLRFCFLASHISTGFLECCFRQRRAARAQRRQHRLRHHVHAGVTALCVGLASRAAACDAFVCDAFVSVPRVSCGCGQQIGKIGCGVCCCQGAAPPHPPLISAPLLLTRVQVEALMRAVTGASSRSRPSTRHSKASNGAAGEGDTVLLPHDAQPHVSCDPFSEAGDGEEETEGEGKATDDGGQGDA